MTLWTVLAVFWILKSWRVRRTKTRESGKNRLSYLWILLAGFALIMERRAAIGPLAVRLWDPYAGWSFLGFLITCTGVAFAIWARNALGEFWSGAVTLKEGHQLIRTGPYAITRHPIYTGIFFAALGTALTVGQLRVVIGLVLVLVAALRKIGTEERFLSQEFGEAYTAYRKSVKALIPYIY